jgi:hypothetical protein
MKLTTIATCFLSVAMLTCAAAANAATCSGHNINSVLLFENNELANGTTLTILRLTSVHVSEDASSPLHLAAGECAGALTATPDGKVRGQGYCMRKDKDGDVYNEEWNLAPGAEKGTWKLAGGNGKYANMSGSGWWQVIMSEGSLAAVRWVGACQ